MNSDKKNGDRITELELAMMHLQRDFDSLNEVVLKNGRLIEKLHSQLERLSDKLADNQTPNPERNLQDEKPPHY